MTSIKYTDLPEIGVELAAQKEKQEAGTFTGKTAALIADIQHQLRLNGVLGFGGCLKKPNGDQLALESFDQRQINEKRIRAGLNTVAEPLALSAYLFTGGPIVHDTIRKAITIGKNVLNRPSPNIDEIERLETKKRRNRISAMISDSKMSKFSAPA